jgi:hypothetical protein
MKKTLTILLATITLLSFSQKNDWKLLKEVDGIKINYKYQECHDVHNGIHQELVVFQFVNKTESDYAINFDFSLTYSNTKTSGSNNSEQHKQLLIKKNSIYESNCNENREYTIFSKFLNYTDKSELQKFELINITITPTKL